MENREYDEKIKQAMRPSTEADFGLNQKIIQMGLEEKEMKMKIFRKPLVAVLALCIILTGSVGVGAAVKYFTAPKAVEELTEDKGFAKAFSEEGAVEINETQSVAGYDITLLGIASGEILRDYNWTVEAKDRTYAVLSISNSDGSAIPEMADDDVGYVNDFYVTPLIEGYAPWWLNAHTLNGGCTYNVINGVLYWLLECDNVEMFADHTIYLGVTEDVSKLHAAYQFDEATGKITANEDYDGINVLFTLPIDKSKASKEKVDAFIEENDLKEWGGF